MNALTIGEQPEKSPADQALEKGEAVVDGKARRVVKAKRSS